MCRCALSYSRTFVHACAPPVSFYKPPLYTAHGFSPCRATCRKLVTVVAFTLVQASRTLMPICLYMGFTWCHTPRHTHYGSWYLYTTITPDCWVIFWYRQALHHSHLSCIVAAFNSRVAHVTPDACRCASASGRTRLLPDMAGATF